MGKKYTIELKDNQTLYTAVKDEDGVLCFFPAILSICKEPDLEQVKKEAYDKGVQETKQYWVDAPRSFAYDWGYENGLKKGLSDVWECTGKIANMSYEERKKIFGEIFIQKIQSIYSASEAIEKIRRYEQEKEEEIQVGDEVRNVKSGWTAVVARISNDKCLTLMDGNGAIADGYEITRFTKTGRHFTEIIELLRKMKEG